MSASAPWPDDEPHRAELARTMQRIAVVGIKDGVADPDAPAFTVPQMMQGMGLQIIGVNPRVPHALGHPTLASVAELPADVDVLDVFRRSDALPELVDQVLALPADRRPAAVWLQSGIRHETAASRLIAAGIPVVQDACLGVYARRYRR